MSNASLLASPPTPGKTAPRAGHFGVILQLLALAPMLAASDTFAKGIGLGVVVVLILPITALVFMGMRRWLAESTAIAAAVLLLAGVVAMVELLMEAWFHDLRVALGLFLPLLATNLVLLERIANAPSADADASPLANPELDPGANPDLDPGPTLRSDLDLDPGPASGHGLDPGFDLELGPGSDPVLELRPGPEFHSGLASAPILGNTLRNALIVATGIALSLMLLGAARELVGRGSLLHDAGRLLGTWAQPLQIEVFRLDMGFLLAMLPPGAFMSLGLLLAMRNWLAERRRQEK